MSFNITVEGGSSVRLPTAGKYCDQDIVITATGGGCGGGGIEHTYTVDYIPSVNTRAFTISIPGFSFAPSYVDCRAVTEIPNPTGLQGAVRFSVYNNFRVSNNPTAYTQGVVITKRTDGGSDYWNVFSRVTATDKEVIIDATTQNAWEFIAGVTYRFIVVEGSG